MSDTPTTTKQPAGGPGKAPTETAEKLEAAKVKKLEAEAKQIDVNAETKKVAAEAYDRAMQVSTTYMNPNTWTQIRTMAKVFHEGKALPSCIQNEAQLIMVMQAGFEMGMKPVECLKSLYIVKGTINVYGAAVVRRLREHGWRVTYKDESDAACTARVVKGRESYEETYTFAEAEKSKYTTDNNGNLKVGWLPGINRKLKLRYGVLSLIIKSYIPDVLGSATDIAEVAQDAIIEDDTPEKITSGDIITNGKGEKVEVIGHKTLAEKLADSKKQKQADAEKKVVKTEPKKPTGIVAVKTDPISEEAQEQLKEIGRKVVEVSGTPQPKKK